MDIQLGVPEKNVCLQIEQVMVGFVESDVRQHNLPPMEKEQRLAVYQIATAFSLTTQSFGQFPNRYVRLLKASLRFLRDNDSSEPVP